MVLIQCEYLDATSMCSYKLIRGPGLYENLTIFNKNKMIKLYNKGRKKCLLTVFVKNMDVFNWITKTYMKLKDTDDMDDYSIDRYLEQFRKMRDPFIYKFISVDTTEYLVAGYRVPINCIIRYKGGGVRMILRNVIR